MDKEKENEVNQSQSPPERLKGKDSFQFIILIAFKKVKQMNQIFVH